MLPCRAVCARGGGIGQVKGEARQQLPNFDKGRHAPYHVIRRDYFFRQSFGERSMFGRKHSLADFRGVLRSSDTDFSRYSRLCKAGVGKGWSMPPLGVTVPFGEGNEGAPGKSASV